MIDILNLALPYFGLIFIGFACGKAKALPEDGLAWMNFFLLYVSLPALLFGIMAKTPFAELNNPPFLIATTLGTITAFVLAMVGGAADRRAVVARDDAGGAFRRLRQYRLYGPRPGAGRARHQGRGTHGPDLLLRQHLPVLDRAAVDRAQRPRTSVAAANTRRGGPADPAQSADHVGDRRRAGRGLSHPIRRSRSTIRCSFCRTPRRRWRCSCSG